MFHCLDIVSIFFPCWLVALTPRRFANGVETQISLFHCVWYQNSVPKISGSIPGSDIQRPFKLANFAATLGVDFLLLLDVNEWLRYECSDEGTYTQKNHNSSTHSHISKEENHIRNRSNGTSGINIILANISTSYGHYKLLHCCRAEENKQFTLWMTSFLNNMSFCSISATG
jgi:hypothetical protein